MTVKSIFFKISAILLFFFTYILSAATLEFAPLDDEFLQYSSGENTSISEIPSPISLPSVVYPSAPSSFDLRSYKKVSSVKDQGTAGSCWAFATYASLESCLLTKENYDFSENHMKNTLSSSYAEGFDRKASDGGNLFMSTAYLVRWSGPVLESQDPYNASSTVSPAGILPAKHIQEVVFIPDRKSSTDNSAIKKAIMDYGAIATTMYYGNQYLAKGKNYCYSGNETSNHAVSIVGWDDSYSRSNFYGSAAGIPPGDGAFIVKNSWGSLWGQSGYFYVSYYDSNIGKNCAVFNNAESVNNYDVMYQYDPLGWVTSAGFNTNTAYFANIFTANQTGTVSAVGFYTPVINSQYEIKIYKNVSGNSPIAGTSAITKSGVISNPGYHTIKLPSDVFVSKNEKFSAVVKLKTPGYNYPIAVEAPISGYSSKASAHPGESFISENGSVWTDITVSAPGTNICLKVYGSAIGFDITSPDGGEIWEQETIKTITWKNNGNVKGNVKIELLRNESLAYIITSSTPVGTSEIGSYKWLIPATINSGSTYKIRITSTNNTSITDTSNENFSITGSKIIVDTPTKGLKFYKSSNQTVQWRYTGKISGTVKIELMKSGISKKLINSSFSIGNNGTGSYIWKIPSDVTPGDGYSIKVTSNTKSGIYGLSEQFSISGPSIDITTPNSGEKWFTNTKQTITWTYSGNPGNTVKIECLKGSSATVISQNCSIGSSGTGSYSWSIPSSYVPGSNYKIRITPVADRTAGDTSDGDFTISPGLIKVISPNGGEIWKPGTKQTILWSYEGNPGSYVSIEVLKGSAVVLRISSRPIGSGGVGSYQWNIPSTQKQGSDYKIRVISTTQPNVSDISDGFLTISNDSTGFSIKNERNEIQEDSGYYYR
jgi:C1A family cysteine protease